MAYAPGLDGVRAVAVAAVLLYHLGTTGVTIGGGADGDGRPIAPGGFLGVDIFFVLSGFLITSLLLAERAESGRISIRQFYVRRARRLLPALYTMMAVVAIASAYFYTDYAARLRGDLIAALTYVTNWWLIAGSSSYFGSGTHPPLLTHLWSLALEEQFYVLWPLALIVLTMLRRRRTMVIIVSLVVVVSTLLAAVLYDPFSDPSRIYYGTDTRLATPLLGALLAIVLRPWLWRGELTDGRRRLLNVGGLVSLIVLGVIAALIDDHSRYLYQGGFLVIAILSGILVLSAAHPAGMMGRALGVKPLRWLGERSYAIYLWHWPIFAVTKPGMDVSWNVAIDLAVRVGLTLIAAELSFRFVEKPLRGGAIGRAIKSWRGSEGRRRTLGALKTSSVALITIVAMTFVGVRLVGAVTPNDVPIGPGPDTSLGALILPGPSKSPGPKGKPSPGTTPSVAPTGRLTQPTRVPDVAVFGDSQGMTLLLNVPSDTGKYVAFKNDTIEGCGILLGKVTSRSGERRDLSASCPNWQSVWTSRAVRDKPDIGLIMIGAWDVFDLTVGGTKLTFGSPAWDAHFNGELTKAVTAVRTSGAKVALSLLPCFRPVRRSAGFWPERGDDDRTRHVNTLLTAAAAANPSYITAVDPPSEFCDDPKISQSLSYRWDGVHYYKPGALLYCKAVLPQLLAIPLS